MVAILIMTMGLGAAVGLANYAFNASSNIIKQIIGMGLAREGIEGVKNMRDTNWLKDTLAGDCYNFETGASDGSCNRNWLNMSVSGGYNIDPGATSATYTLAFDPAQANFWQLASQGSNYTLNYNATGSTGLYSPGAVGAASGYFRRITIAKDATGPFVQTGVGPRLTVTSEVWWNEQRCPIATAAAPPTSGSCKIKLQMYLTNWRDY